MVTLKKRFAHRGFDLKAKDAKFSHFHPPYKTDKMWFSTHSNEWKFSFASSPFVA
jgi:hypothetical protein